MKPYAFQYHVPTSVAEVLELLGAAGDDDVIVMAGGQTLVPVLNMRLARPDAIIDLNRVSELFKLQIVDAELCIGAMVRHMTLETDPEVSRHVPLMAEAAKYIAHLQIRTRGTIGGSLCNAAPASEWTTVVAALDATMVLQNSAGEIRNLQPDEFFDGPMTTSLEPDEILVEVRVPIPDPNTGWAFLESSRRHGDFAQAGAAIVVNLASDGKISKVRIAMCGLSTPGLRFKDIEAFLIGKTLDDAALDRVESLVMATDEAPEDFHISAQSRRTIAATMVRRALIKAVERAEISKG